MINVFTKAIKNCLRIPAKRKTQNAKRKTKSTLLFGKSKQKFQLYEHPNGSTYQLLMVAVSPKHNSEWAIYRSEKTGVVYTRPMREFKEKFKEFNVGM